MAHAVAYSLILLIIPVPILLSSPDSQDRDIMVSSIATVPAWAKSAVWYQIFPERFRNGDPSNDPTVKDMDGSWPHEQPKEWKISRWTGDWYAIQPWETIGGKGFYYTVQQRRYGGDLQGVLDMLEYLKELGITAIYFNPLFESPSLHKYDATMYHHIDNNFGPDPEGDKKIWESEDPADPATWKWTSADKLFLKLLSEAHAREMKVIIDGVFNHVGMTHWAFVDVRKKGDKSQYKNWFIVTSWDNLNTPDDEFVYTGWNGVKELPELREDENGLVTGPREHVHHIVKRWMDPNGDGNPADGIDGWRLDVAEKVAIPFWREFRKWVREINPEAYLVGEVWWEEWKNDKMFNAEPWLRGDVFDAVMNYRWAREVANFFIAKKNQITASEFDTRLTALRNDYRTETNYVLMNLMDSHDTDRLASHIVNVDSYYDKNVSVKDNARYVVRRPTPAEIQIQKLIVLFQMTYLGAPTVYYGSEAGMWGGDDPDDRKPMLWADRPYDDEISHPFGNARPRDKNEVDTDLLSWYRTLIAIRNSHPSLSTGSISTLAVHDGKDVYGFLRSDTNEYIAVIINNSWERQQVAIQLNENLGSLRWKNLMTSEMKSIDKNEFRLTVLPKSGTLLGANVK